MSSIETPKSNLGHHSTDAEEAPHDLLETPLPRRVNGTLLHLCVIHTRAHVQKLAAPVLEQLDAHPDKFKKITLCLEAVGADPERKNLLDKLFSSMINHPDESKSRYAFLRLKKAYKFDRDDRTLLDLIPQFREIAVQRKLPISVKLVDISTEHESAAFCLQDHSLEILRLLNTTRLYDVAENKRRAITDSILDEAREYIVTVGKEVRIRNDILRRQCLLEDAPDTLTIVFTGLAHYPVTSGLGSNRVRYFRPGIPEEVLHLIPRKFPNFVLPEISLQKTVKASEGMAITRDDARDLLLGIFLKQAVSSMYPRLKTHYLPRKLRKEGVRDDNICGALAGLVITELPKAQRAALFASCCEAVWHASQDSKDSLSSCMGAPVRDWLRSELLRETSEAVPRYVKEILDDAGPSWQESLIRRLASLSCGQR